MTTTIPPVTGSEDWRDSALCAQTDPALWFPEKGEPAREAKRICSGCEVSAECLTDALSKPLAQDRYGVRGGLSPTEREKLRKAGP